MVAWTTQAAVTQVEQMEVVETAAGQEMGVMVEEGEVVVGVGAWEDGDWARVGSD